MGRKISLIRAGIFVVLGATVLLSTGRAVAAPCDHPLIFVTQVPVPADFTTIGSTFGNQLASMDSVARGGDLYIRYADGSLKNLTQAAGYGNTGFQGASSIAVRDPAVHWDGNKVLFSMVVGAPTQRYQVKTFYWQLYEISGLGQSDTPVISKVANQPENFNNVMGTYASDDRIIFVTDRPRNGAAHLYPQLDEYESAQTNSGLWSLNPVSGELFMLDHAPSGAFHPSIDSYGRVIYTRWDHLQRDQQNLPSQPSFKAITKASEDVGATSTTAYSEVFPEPRDSDEPDYSSAVNLHSFNQFFPWSINEDGTDHETLNHIGRQELHGYIEKSFTSDNNLMEYYGQYNSPNYNTKIQNMFQIQESAKTRGVYFGIDAPEFGTHAAGQIITLNGPLGLSADDMTITYITHPDTRSTSNNPGPNHSGLYRNPIQCADGSIVASHTSETRQDANDGSAENPQSRYPFRLKAVEKSGSYYLASTAITSGISKSINWWSPDVLVSYSGALWELQPVEVRSRVRPIALKSALQAPEKSIFSELGVNENALREYLVQNGLALITGRNVTTRDDLDKQQPYNLRVEGTDTKTLANGGKIYDVAALQFVLGEQVRGYEEKSGLRVLAKFISDLASYNPNNSSSIGASVPLASDGSWAAFIPARRALSWQLVDSSGKPVVRERYWVTFGKGEIRVCGSCHGANKLDQGGNLPPDNAPLALKSLLESWKSLPPSGPSFRLSAKTSKVRGKSLKSGSNTFGVQGLKQSTYGTTITLKLAINGKDCSGSGVSLALNARGKGSVVRKLTFGKKIKSLSLRLYSDGVRRVSTNFKVSEKSSGGSAAKICKAFSRRK